MSAKKEAVKEMKTAYEGLKDLVSWMRPEEAALVLPVLKALEDALKGLDKPE